jgi:hypothetical protein
VKITKIKNSSLNPKSIIHTDKNSKKSNDSNNEDKDGKDNLGSYKMHQSILKTKTVKNAEKLLMKKNKTEYLNYVSSHVISNTYLSDNNLLIKLNQTRSKRKGKLRSILKTRLLNGVQTRNQSKKMSERKIKMSDFKKIEKFGEEDGLNIVDGCYFKD